MKSLGISASPKRLHGFLIIVFALPCSPVRSTSFPGEIEADETFIGGKARNMHVEKRKRRITGTGGKDKTAVMGILQRGGKVRTSVVGDRKKKSLQREVRKHVEAGSALYTDALLS